jgi:uncharacterized membrane protein YczE
MAEEPHKLPVGDDYNKLTTLTPAFKLVFCSVLGLTVLSLGVSVYLAIAYSPAPSEEIKRLIETCSTTWKMGFGAIVGLIGGKAL